jgi:uncharacterized protein YndB with AHSA1/START domain
MAGASAFHNGNFLVTVLPVKVYESSAEIQAPPEKVWALLTDAPAVPDWNPTVERIEGTIAPGETIKVHVPINPGRAFPVKVTGFQPPHRMVWTGGMPLGLFKGERTFTLTSHPDGTTGFRMREQYTGLMLPLIWRSMPDQGPAFAEYAEALKRRAESG